MALVFMEGFDHIDDTTNTSSYLGKWTTWDTRAVFETGRWGTGYCCSCYNPTKGGLSLPDATMIIGFSLKTTVGNSIPFYIVGSSGNNTFWFTINTNGTITVTGGTTWTSTLTVNLNAWYYFEVKVKVANSPNGFFELRVDDQTYVSATGVDTANQSADISFFRIGAANTATFRYDDIYVCNNVDATTTQGYANNDFLGPIRVYTLYPSGAGFHSDFTPSGTSYSANNWENVDEVGYPNDDTDFNYAPSGIHNDSFTMTSLPADVYEVRAVQSNLRAKKDDVGSRQIKATIRASGTDYVSSGYPISDTWAYYSTIHGKNPYTDAGWETGDFTVVEFGYESGEY